jgi:hypothetical protein
MSNLAKRVIAPNRLRIYSAGGILNWKLSLIYNPRNALKRVLFRFSLAASIASRESFSLPPEIQQYLERYFASTKLNFVVMTSHYNSRWILAVKSKESNLAIVVKYGSIIDPGLIQEEEFHRKFRNIDLRVPIIESFTTNSHRVLVFPYYPTRNSLRANQLELADIASRLEALHIKHNDLAPWNTVRKDKELLVIDWEGFEESSERSEIKGQDSQASYKRYLWVSLIASSIGNFLLTFFVARGDFVASELGKFSSLFAAYALLLGISRAILSEVNIAISLNKNSMSRSGKKTRFLTLISILTSIAIVPLLLSSSVNLGLSLAIVLLSGPIILDYFRFEFLRILDARSVMLLDVSWTALFVILLLYSSSIDFYLDPIKYFLVWEVSALLAFMMILIAKRPRFIMPLVTRQDLPSKNLEKRNEVSVLALFDYMAMYGTTLLFSISLFSVVDGNSAFVYRLSTMLLAVLPLLAQVTLFTSRNLWMGNVLKNPHLGTPDIQRDIRSKIVFAAIGGLLCLSSLFLPYEDVFTTLKIVGKEDFQLLLFFQFLSYFSIFVTTEIRHWLRYFGDLKLYSLGVALYLLANVLVSVVSLLKRDLILWTALIALLNVVFILIWTLLYRSATSRQNQ